MRVLCGCECEGRERGREAGKRARGWGWSTFCVLCCSTASFLHLFTVVRMKPFGCRLPINSLFTSRYTIRRRTFPRFAYFEIPGSSREKHYSNSNIFCCHHHHHHFRVHSQHFTAQLFHLFAIRWKSMQQMAPVRYSSTSSCCGPSVLLFHSFLLFLFVCAFP